MLLALSTQIVLNVLPLEFVPVISMADSDSMQEDGQEKMDAWIEESGMDRENGAVVLKPAEEGSSINVRFAFGLQDAIEHAHDLLANEGARLVRVCSCLLGLFDGHHKSSGHSQLTTSCSEDRSTSSMIMI